MLLIWYEDVFPLSKTALALLAEGIICRNSVGAMVKGASQDDTNMNIVAIDCKYSFLSGDEHWHLSVNCIFLGNGIVIKYLKWLVQKYYLVCRSEVQR